MIRGRHIAARVGLALILGSFGRAACRADDPQPKPMPPAGSEPSEASARLASLVERTRALYEAGKYAEAVPLARQVVALQEGAPGTDPRDLAESLNNLAFLLERVDGRSEARKLYERALTILEKARGKDHSDLCPT